MSRKVTGVRSEKIDTRQVLLGHLGYANGTELARRRREREQVIAYWPRGLLDGIVGEVYVAPPWTLLQRPTTMDADANEVIKFVTGYLSNRRCWPLLDDVIRMTGKVSNHRTPGEAVGQGSLL